MQGFFLKYQKIFSTTLIRSFEYRANFLISIATLLIVNPIVQIFLWNSVYDSLGNSASINGMSRENMIVYTLFAIAFSRLSSTGRSERAVGDEIRNGDLNKYILRPISHSLYSFSVSCAEKVPVALTASLFLVGSIVFLSIANIPIEFSLSAAIVAFSFAFLGMTLQFMISLCISYCAFWMEEVWTFHVVKDISFVLLSGQVIPLTVMPEWGHKILHFLPFQFASFVPAAILSGTISSDTLQEYALIGCIWLLILLGLVRLIWKRGILRYSAFGG